jgi:predicted RNA-binding protein with PIN domain
MLLLIDGYNLLNTSDIFPRGKGAGTLAAAREELLKFLAAALPPKLRSRTTIVFDAALAPPGLPREQTWEGIAVRFAPRKATADELLEELIAAAADPRHLLVVSSDHRVQRAARQRGAQWIDSEKWYAELVAESRKAAKESPGESDKPAGAEGINPFPPGYGADVASEDWRPPRRGRGRKNS